MVRLGRTSAPRRGRQGRDTSPPYPSSDDEAAITPTLDATPREAESPNERVWINSSTRHDPSSSGLRRRHVGHTSSNMADTQEPVVEKIVITRAEVNGFGLRKVRRKLFKFRQQRFSHFMRLSSSFRRYNGAKLLAAIGIGLVIVGLLVLGLTSEVVFEIPYNTTTTVTQFEVSRDVNGPFFVYARILGFYANTRNFLESKPTYYEAGRCGVYDTADAAWYIRPKESIPELSNMTADTEVRPCGIAAFTYFNDKIALTAVDACPDGEQTCSIRAIDISTTSVAPRELFTLYTRVPTDEEEKNSWLNPLLETRYQGWMYSPFGWDSVVLLGSLKDYTLYRGTHELAITANLWPAEHFAASKSIVIMSLGSLGARQTFLGLLSLSWGLCMVILSLLFLWALRRNLVFASSSLVGVSPEELREQWILHATEWLDPLRSRPLGLQINRSLLSRRRGADSGEIL